MTLTQRGQLYVSTVAAAGLMVLGHCISTVFTDPIRFEWLILAGLTLLTGSFTVKVPALRARISVSETFVFTSVLLFGVCAGTITVALDALIAALSTRDRSRNPIRLLFNLSSATLSIWVASLIFYEIAGIPPLAEATNVRLPQILVPLIVLTLAYFLMNSLLVAGALAFERTGNWFTIWRHNFMWLAVNYFGGASVAALLVSYTRTIDLTALSIIVPLLVISYLTFQTSFSRLEDAAKHVEEIRGLYLSTIETLATAIDAKDQVTHGHIRRVQRFALGLAHELGVHDQKQLKALEAAALLHDTGKLVVPEHILNKPGKLTPGEFEKMKLHASAGADILSTIQFPYPVVPIVRHHHEAWDGTGYPDGLRGTEIPIGARILAVVDCFDALTSDRPYRRKLSDEEAVKILVQRRGTMYDPLVVDTFAAVKEKLASLVDSADADTGIETVLQRPRREPTPVRIPVTQESLPDDTLEQIRPTLEHAKEETGADLIVVMLKDAAVDQLGTRAHVGNSAYVDRIGQVQLGTRVTGWVAANGRAIVNADAALDFTDAHDFGIRRCTSIPIEVQHQVVGAVTGYTQNPDGFDAHAIVELERAAKQVGASLQSEFDEITRRTSAPAATRVH